MQILTPEPDSGRFGVLLDSGKEIKVRRENLSLEEESFDGLRGLKGGFLAGGGKGGTGGEETSAETKLGKSKVRTHRPAQISLKTHIGPLRIHFSASSVGTSLPASNPTEQNRELLIVLW